MIPNTFAALRHRDYKLFWTGHCVSVIGTWMQNVGQAWLVLQLTDSPFLLGLVSSLQFTPMLLLSLFAGVIVDRLPKRSILLFTQSALMVLAAVLAVLTSTGAVQYWHVLVLAALTGLVQTVDNPTRQALVIELVGKDDLTNAVAMNSMAFNVARLVGPALAGILIGAVGTAACFYINALSFLAVLASAYHIQAGRYAQVVKGKALLGDIRDGLSFIRRTPLVLTCIALVGVVSIFAINFNVLVPVFARDVLGLESTGYGFLMSALGVGALAGAINLASTSGRGPRIWLLLAGGAGLTATHALLGLVRSPFIAAAGLGIMGFSMISLTVSANTVIQLNVPNEYRGRVMSAYMLVFGGSAPIGALFAGAVASWLGAAAAWSVGGGIALTVVAAVISRQRRWLRGTAELP